MIFINSLKIIQTLPIFLYDRIAFEIILLLIEMEKKIPLHLIIIAMIYVMLFFVSTVLDNKLVKLWIFEVPAPFLYFNFIYALSDATTEVYSPKMTWSFLIIGYLVTAFFVFLAVGIIALPSPIGARFSAVQNDYNLISQTMLTCLGWGYLAFFTGSFVNVKLLAKWKLKYKGKFYYWRSLGASCISEAIVTIIAQFLIWNGRLSLHEVIYTILNGYPFAIATTIIWALLGTFIKNALYTIEGKEVYQYNQDFFARTSELN